MASPSLLILEASLLAQGVKGMKRFENFLKREEEKEAWRQNASPEDIEYLECQEELSEQLLEQHTQVERVIGESPPHPLTTSPPHPSQLHATLTTALRSTCASGGAYPMQSVHGRMGNWSQTGSRHKWTASWTETTLTAFQTEMHVSCVRGQSLPP